MQGYGSVVAGDGCISVTRIFPEDGREVAASPSFSVDGSMPESLSFGDTWPARCWRNLWSDSSVLDKRLHARATRQVGPSKHHYWRTPPGNWCFSGAFWNIGCRSKTPSMKYNMELNPSWVLSSYKSHSCDTRFQQTLSNQNGNTCNRMCHQPCMSLNPHSECKHPRFPSVYTFIERKSYRQTLINTSFNILFEHLFSSLVFRSGPACASSSQEGIYQHFGVLVFWLHSSILVLSFWKFVRTCT